MTTVGRPGLYGPPSIAQPGSSSATSGGGGGSSSATFTFWNPADKQADIVVSNEGLTASRPSGLGGGYAGVIRANLGKSTGKWYYEFTANNEGDHDFYFYGLANATALLTTRLGETGNNSIGARRGAIRYGGSQIVNGTTFNNLETPALAVDLDAKLIWFYCPPTGWWNNDPGANPATATGGIDISAMTLPAFPAISFGADGTQTGSGNFGAQAFAHSLPTGFAAWGSDEGAAGNFLSLAALGDADVGGDLSVVGETRTSASTTARAGLNVAPGVAPTAPVDGDIWVTTAGLFVRINGATVGPLT